MTEAEKRALRELPKGWKIVKLGNERVAKLIMGQSPPSSSYNGEKEGLPFCQGNTEFGPIHPLKIEQYTSQPMKIAESGDVLISVRAPVGDVNIANFKLCIGRGLAAIRPDKEKMSEFYLFYQLKHNETRIKRMSGGSTFKAITKKDLQNLSIPLPPLPEQRKIAEILGSVDSAIQAVDSAISKAERVKKGLMQNLLTEGIGHTEFKETEIGRIPEEWEVVRLGEIGKQRKETIIPSREEELLYIGLEHIEPGKVYINRTGSSSEVKSLKFRFKEKDILYGKLRPYLDKAVIADVSGVCSTDILVITTNEKKAISEFLIYVLHSKKFINYSTTTMTGTNHPRTSWKSLSKFPLALPPLPEQQKIAEILSAVDEKIGLERERKAKLERVKKGLMNDLLTGKKRVRINEEA